MARYCRSTQETETISKRNHLWRNRAVNFWNSRSLQSFGTVDLGSRRYVREAFSNFQSRHLGKVATGCQGSCLTVTELTPRGKRWNAGISAKHGLNSPLGISDDFLQHMCESWSIYDRVYHTPEGLEGWNTPKTTRNWKIKVKVLGTIQGKIMSGMPPRHWTVQIWTELASTWTFYKTNFGSGFERATYNIAMHYQWK